MAGVLAACVGMTARAASRPDYGAAAEFGVTLQREFLARREAAIMEHIDSDAMRRRAFGPFGDEMSESEAGKRAWTETFYPTVTKMLKSAAARSSMFVFCRVILLDDARQVEGMLVGTDGNLEFVRLHLCFAANGGIAIDDFCFAGSELEATRSIRHIVILLGVRGDKPLDDEETQLCVASDGHGGAFRLVMELFGNQKPEAAFDLLSAPANRIDETKIWRQLRNMLALAGSEGARSDLRAAVEARAVDSFLEYQIWQQSGDRERTLAALERVLVEYRELPFLRLVKAGLLLEMERPEEAYAIAVEVRDCNPGLISAYFMTLRAALATGRMEKALAVVRAWAEAQPPGDVASSIEAEATLAEFAKSAGYTEWKKQAVINVPQSSQAEPPAAMPSPPASGA